jgi:CheY-like chemotaxis protein
MIFANIAFYCEQVIAYRLVEGRKERAMPKTSRVLVIDDDRQILRLFRRVLEDGGVSVVVAESGQKALDLLRDQAFKVVVVDMSMPDPDGFEVLRTLRSNPHHPRILAVSGYMHGELLAAAEFLGADATLNKADAPTLLLDTVNDLLR